MELAEFIVEEKIDVAVITETWLEQKISLFVDGYSVERFDRPAEAAERGGGVAILVKHGINFKPMGDLKTKVIEAVGVRVQAGGVSLNIIAAYFPGGRTKEDRVNFKRDIRELTKTNEAYFIVGDLNSRHRSWHCLRANQTGNILANMLPTSTFYVHAPEAPTYVPRGSARPSTIDLVISNNQVEMSIPVVHQELSSDHLPVTFEIDCELAPSTPTQRFRCYDRADWTRFRQEIDRRLDPTSDEFNNLTSTSEVDAAIQMFTAALLEAEDVAVPWFERDPQKVKLPQNIKLLITLRNTRRRQFIRTRDPLLGMIVQSLNLRIQNECSKLRFKNFGNTIQELSNGHKQFWRISKLVRNTVKHNPPFRVGDTLAISPAEKAKVLGESFAKAHLNPLPADPEINAAVNRSLELTAAARGTNDDWSTYTKPNEIKTIVRRLKNKKAPGFDGLRNIVIKQLPRKGLVVLTKIINACLKLHYFPDVWKQALVVGVPKPNKDITQPGSYRPISLLSTLSKVLERVILARLNRHLDNNLIIPDEQFGFRKGHSTNHQLVRITQAIKKGFLTKKSTGMVMLDVEKAYDSVWQDAIIHKLIVARFPMYLVKLIQSFLRERSFQVTVNGSLSPIHGIPFGVPQGSVLSPTLYNVFSADVLMVDGVSYAFFADDTGYFVSDSDPKVIKTKLQAAQNHLQEFQRQWRIKINPTKTQAVFFSRRRSPRYLPSSKVKVCGLEVDWSNEAKYLGVLLDKMLLFDKHTDQTLKKCKSLIRSLYSLVNRRSRLQLHNKLLLYKCVFRAVLTYGFPAWKNCAATHRKKLQRMQNKLLKMIYNLDPWYPTDDLHQLAELDTIDEFIDRMFLKFRTSCQMSDNPLISAIDNY